MTARSARLGIFFVALCLCGCGAAGTETASQHHPTYTAPERLEILTTRIPPAQSDTAYPATQLRARGGVGPLRWNLTGGELPRGMALASQGTLSGSPEAKGLYAFEVGVTDGWSADVRTLHLAVDTFGVSVQGLHFGEVWSETLLTLEALGNEGDVTFELETTASGGAFDRLEPEASRAVYYVGATKTTCRDVIRATDTASGDSTFVELDVVPHPGPNHRAEFGGSDVWYVDTTAHVHDHGFPSDWDAILNVIGMRSDCCVPTMADRLAVYYVRRLLLSELNGFFGRNTDGSLGSGLPISFPMDRPDAPYEAPAPGTWAEGASHRYNVMGVLWGSRPGVLGLAFVDSELNHLVENDTTAEDLGELGVFGNQLAHSFNFAYVNDHLPDHPICEDDEASLRELVHGRPVEGDRPELIRQVCEGFARSLAAVVAHEIGHSLGLRHTSPPVRGSIMSAGAAIYPGAPYAFTPSDLRQLAGALPGPGRAFGAEGRGPAVVFPSFPAGGIDALRAEEE